MGKSVAGARAPRHSVLAGADGLAGGGGAPKPAPALFQVAAAPHCALAEEQTTLKKNDKQ